MQPINVNHRGAVLTGLLVSLASCIAQPLPVFDFTDPAERLRWQPNPYISNLATTPKGLEVQLNGADPYLRGPATNYPAGQLLWLRLRLHSESGGTCQLFYYTSDPSEPNSVKFTVPAGQWHEAIAPVPVLGPGWRLRIDPPGTSGICVLERLWFEERVILEPPVWPVAGMPVLGSDAVTLQVGDLEMVHDVHSVGAFHVKVAGQLMAVGYPQARMAFLEDNTPQWLPFGNSPTHPTMIQRAGDGVSVVSEVQDSLGARWRIEQGFQPAGTNAIAVNTRLTVNADREVIYLPPFTLLPGVGAFGTNKTQGLLCGLEYLANEPSSSELDIIGDGARRLVPDTAKITLPLMAISANDRYLGLVWEPQKDLCAVFDSPDRQFGSEGHLFGLLFPGSDGFVRDEGSLMPYRGTVLQSNQTWAAHCTILGGPGATMVAAMQQYVAREGLPALPVPAMTAGDAFNLFAHGWLDSQIRSNTLYRHAYWPGFSPSPAADAAVWMKWLSGKVTDPILAAELAVASTDAIAAVTPAKLYNTRQIGHVRFPLPALIFNEAMANASQARVAAQSQLSRFEPDGTVLYVPKSGGPDYGSTHFAADANGLTATVLLQLLENALFAGDREKVTQAVAHLRAMDKFHGTVPRGAQTWEIPLHTPDILASAKLVRCYTLGYEVTGDPGFLEQSKYWAWTGLPFIYLTQPVPGDVALYATIPVYGATTWVGSWFGRPVQWCGLVYADALNHLAPHDPDGPWRQIADGIAASGIQQVWPLTDTGRQGLLPDFVILKSQYRDGPAINPATVFVPSLWLQGEVPPYAFHSFRAHALWLHAPGAIGQLEETASHVSFTLTNGSSGAASLLMNGFLQTPGVRVNGTAVPLTEPHGYDSATGRLILQLHGTNRVEVIHRVLPRVQIRQSAIPEGVDLLWPATHSNFLLEATAQVSAAQSARFVRFRNQP